MKMRRLLLGLLMSAALILTFIPTISFGEEGEEPLWNVWAAIEDVYLSKDEPKENLTVMDNLGDLEEGADIPELSYQWYSSTGDEITGANDPSYTVDKEGEYYCEVTDGREYSTNVWFYVYYQTQWKVSAVEEDAYLTKSNPTVDLIVEPDFSAYEEDEDLPKLSYKWYDNSSGDEITNTNDATYTADKEGTYTCEVTDDEGHINNVWFGVSFKTEWTIEKANDDVYITKSKPTVELGVVPNFPKGSEAPELSYQWFREGYNEDGDEVYEPIQGATGSTYKANQKGDYYCEATDEEGHLNTVWFYVRYETDWSISAANEDVFITKSDPTVELKVVPKFPEDTEAQELSYQWFHKEYDEEEGNIFKPISGATDPTYKADQTGEYYCDATDEEGYENTVWFTVYYQTEWTIENDNPSEAISKAKPSVNLKVEADTSKCSENPELTYQWYYEGPDDEEYKAIEGATNVTYAADKEGNYYCKVTDKDGHSNDSDFYVYYQTEWTVESVESEVELSKTSSGVDLKVKADTAGYELTYQWYKRVYDEDEGHYEAIDGATESTYRATDTGKYLCTVTDKEGHSTDLDFYVYNGFSEVTDKLISNTAEEIGLNDTKTVNTEEKDGLFIFRPTEDGTYVFYSNHSDDSADPVGRVLDNNKKELVRGDDFDDSNFQIAFQAKAGETYYLQAMNYSGSATFTVVLMDSEISSISFAPGNEPLTASRYCESSDRYRIRSTECAGDKLTILHKDGSSEVYVCKEFYDTEDDDTYTKFVSETKPDTGLPGWIEFDMDETFDASIAPGSAMKIAAKASYMGLASKEFTRSVEFSLNHDELKKTEAKAATCDTEGNSAYWYCKGCKKYFSDEKGNEEIEKDSWIIPTGHKLTKTDKVDATCEKTGTAEYWTCSVCKKMFSDANGKNQIDKPAVIPVAAHKLVKTDKVDATCEKAGTEEYWTCGVCKKKFSDEKGTKEITEPAVIPATGHKLTKTEKVEPTIKTEGTEAYWTCSVCKKMFSDAEAKNEISEPVKIAKLPDPVKQKGADGTALGKGASAAAAEKAITAMKSDKDPAGSSFAILKLKSTKQAKNSLTLNWSKAKGATKYVVYGNLCGKANKMKKLATVKTNKYVAKKIINKKGKKVKVVKGKNYKFIVVALDKKNNVVSTSKVIHAATAGTKLGNYKSVTVSKKVIKSAAKLKKGKTLKLGAKAVPVAKKKVSKHVGLRYQTTNKEIATVSAKGVVKGIKKGTCYVYAYAQNGVFKAVKVVVK